MKKKEPVFITSVFDLKKLPSDLPFVVFAGRSNVGKSSAINALAGRKNLAHTSSKPGKTASINLYQTDDSFYIADLPGFGYAKVSKEQKKSWGSLIDGFFESHADILLVVHFIDVRHEPQPTDLMLTEYLAATELPFCTVFTKADKLSPAAADNNLVENTKILRKMLKGTNANMLSPVLFSAEKKQGVDMLNSIIDQFANNR